MTDSPQKTTPPANASAPWLASMLATLLVVGGLTLAVMVDKEMIVFTPGERCLTTTVFTGPSGYYHELQVGFFEFSYHSGYYTCCH
jgi:hypothetical protein